uniref:molybdopterin cofactor-binding domain-containing protein n=1 Tax=Limnohabitans sp. TaxID=1907725 RepID=UPI004048BA73
MGAWQTAEPAPVTLAVNAVMAVGGGSERNAQPPYDIASVQVINHRVLNMPFRVSAMRALGAPVNVLAAESVMDEWAHRLSQD